MSDFPHAMLREIFEQPEAIRRTLDLYTSGHALKAEAFAPIAPWLNPRGEVLIAASGSSRHAGLVAEILLEDLCGLAVDVEYASEWGCRGTANPRHPPALVISQSGETSDTLAALRQARDRREQTLAIAECARQRYAARSRRVPGAGRRPREGDSGHEEFHLPVDGALSAGIFWGARPVPWMRPRLIAASELAQRSETQLRAPAPGVARSDGRAGQDYADASTFLYLGRGIHYAIAREGALKMKESSYVHAEGYPSGELKHGPNALVATTSRWWCWPPWTGGPEDSMLRYEKTLQLLDDMKKQGARIIALANTGDEQVRALATDTIEIDPAGEYLLPIAEVIPLQLFSYFMALEHGVDVDRPRNLSKAVIEL